MGLPNINIAFKTQGASAISRSQKGVVAIALKDTASSAAGAHVMYSAADIPAELTEANKGILTRAFMGYVNAPKKVIAYAFDGTTKSISDALDYFSTQEFDYLAGTGAEGEAETITTWVKSERANDHMVKAVAANYTADCEAVVNFTTEGIKAGGVSYTTADYCSRIAGLIAGTPMTISCTYAPLPEVTEITRLSKDGMDDAIDAGELILYHDGQKVKVARGVTSLTTTTQDKGEAFQKIKIVEAADMIHNDIRRTAQDSYIGKYANSYDNKCLLITAIQGYFEQLENDGILKRGESSVSVDLTAQENYLKSKGIDTSEMSEQEIKEADTGSKVFLAASVKILDAIEDIDLNIVI